MCVNSLPKTVTRQRRGCDLNPGPEIQTDVVTVAAEQSFLSFVSSPVLASVGFWIQNSLARAVVKGSRTLLHVLLSKLLNSVTPLPSFGLYTG